VTGSVPLHVLVVDDEAPAREDVHYLLERHPAVGVVDIAVDAEDGLRRLQAESYDGVFLDVRMPGLDGLELARVLRRFADPPAVVFVTAFEEHARDAFDVHACDYLLKPVSEPRLAEAVRCILDARRMTLQAQPDDDLAVVPVETGGRTLLVDRDDVCWVEANGDYARLHTVQGVGYLVRLPLAMLEERWSAAGFVRAHRSHLVALRYVTEVRTDAVGGAIVRVAGHELPVSRRNTAELKRRLLRLPRSDRAR
jgi:DNA-binding LytR/AlgR family response regulator